MPDATKLRELAVGAYTAGEVQRLAGVPTPLTRRFLSKYKGELGLWGGITNQAQHFDGRWYATFRDMIELRCVNAFHRAGVSWQRVLRSYKYACQRFQTDYPFSHRRFLTEGWDIFSRTDEGLKQISVCGQYAFEQIIRPELFDPMEYEMNAPVRWYPAREWGWTERENAVLVDPLRAFGAPVLTDSGVPTLVLYDCYRAEGCDASRVSRIYEVSPELVQVAVNFEQQLVRRGASSDK